MRYNEVLRTRRLGRPFSRRLTPEFEILGDRLTPVGNPILNSWIKAGVGEYAQAISGFNVAAGPSATWPNYVPPGGMYSGGVSTPTIADITKISYSTNWVYASSSGLASYVMGPWFFSTGAVFPNFPSNQNKIVRLPLNPQPATSHTANNLGSIGVWDNGVAMFNMLDGFTYSNARQRDDPSNGPPNQTGDGYWNRDANASEGPTFDHAHAHQPQSGEYHYHANPTALREQLGDNIEYVGTTTGLYPYDPTVLAGTPDGDAHAYHEYAADLHHSPILGFAFDGYPVYGPYGYSNPTDPNSPIERMSTSYRLRNITTRTKIPGWAAQAKFGDGVALDANGEYPLPANLYGPAVSASFPIGWYTEDYEYVSGLGNLDKYNGRFAVTPEYPSGTYAYFVTVDSTGEEVFPYVIGRQYYGQATGSKVTSITEAVTTTFDVSTHPTISPIIGQSTNQNTPRGPLPFTVGDAQTAAAGLIVAATSSNPTLVPVGNIAFGGSGAARNVTVTPFANQTGTTTIALTVTDGSGLTNTQSFTLTVRAVDTTSPAITGVFLDGSTWTTAFRAAAGNVNLGYPAQTGSSQLTSLPWSTINTISIQFSENVVVDAADLGIRGLNVANYSIANFTYDSVNFIGTWVLSSTFDTDRVLLDLDGDSAAAVVDLAGNKLAGNWIESVGTFPTAGAAGIDFKYRFVVAVGDGNRDGIVRNADANLVRGNLFVDASQVGYSIYLDIDGNGQTRNADNNAVRSHLFVDPPGGPGPFRPGRFAVAWTPYAASLAEFERVRTSTTMHPSRRAIAVGGDDNSVKARVVGLDRLFAEV